MVYEHPQFPADLKAEMYAWVREHATEERKPKDTEEQFIYKARKKAIGPFKKQMWSIEANHRRAIGQSLEERFTFLMKQLKIADTAAAVSKFVQRRNRGHRSRGRDRCGWWRHHGCRKESGRSGRLVVCAARTTLRNRRALTALLRRASSGNVQDGKGCSSPAR